MAVLCLLTFYADCAHSRTDASVPAVRRCDASR